MSGKSVGLNWCFTHLKIYTWIFWVRSKTSLPAKPPVAFPHKLGTTSAKQLKPVGLCLGFFTACFAVGCWAGWVSSLAGCSSQVTSYLLLLFPKGKCVCVCQSSGDCCVLCQPRPAGTLFGVRCSRLQIKQLCKAWVRNSSVCWEGGDLTVLGLSQR